MVCVFCTGMCECACAYQCEQRLQRKELCISSKALDSRLSLVSPRTQQAWKFTRRRTEVGTPLSISGRGVVGQGSCGG